MLTCQQNTKRCKVNSIHQNDLTSLNLLWIISRKSEANLPSKILERLSQPGLQNLDAKYHPDWMIDAAFHGLWPVKRALFQGFYQTSGEYLSSPLLRTPTKWSIDLKNCSLFHPVDIQSDLFFVVKYKTRMTMFIVQLNWHPADAQLNMEKKIYEIYEMKVQPDRHGGDGTVRLNGAGSWRVGQVICDKD